MLSADQNPLGHETGTVPRVEVRTGREPYALTRDALAACDLSGAQGRRVLIKPNAGRVASPGDGVTTAPGVVAAAIDAFVDAGADVSVGESPIAGVDTMEALETTGIAAAARERNCPVIDLDARPPVTVDYESGVAMQQFRVCAAVAEHDLVVSIPVAKTHMHTGVTLAVKNMKGCLWRRSKVDLHMLDPVAGRGERPLELAINDMAHVLRPHFAIVDATVGMEGLGPSAGEPKALGAVIVSHDAYAADAVMCYLMGIDASEIVHLRLGDADGLGCLALDQMDIRPSGWREAVSPFKRAPEKIDIDFDNVRILDSQSCSACQSTLLLFLKRYGDRALDYFSTRPVNVAIGKGHDRVDPGTLCIGNCTSRHREDGLFVPGCPPVGSSIMKAIEEDAS